MSDHAANDAQASTGSLDDESTTSSTSQPNKTTRFYKRLAASWLTLYDQKVYLKDKVESLQSAGPAANEPDFTNAVTERKTVDIKELRAYTALQDWLPDNDPDGTFLAIRDAAVETFGPLLDERTRLIQEVVRTLRELNETATNSSGAPDPTYDARAAAHQRAKDELATNDALIRGTLESYRSEPGGPPSLPPAAASGPAIYPIPAAPTPPSASGGPTPPPSLIAPLLRDNIFSGVKIACAYTYIPEHKALHWPSDEDRASLLERTSVSALRAGMVIPVLQFAGIEAFTTLVEPDAYYVVTAEHPDNSMRLSLAYKNPACTRVLPPCLTFEARTTTYSVIVMADAAIRGNIWEPHVLAALRAMNVPLTAPDTPLAHRLFSPGAPNQYGVRDAQVRADKAFQPLRRALHNDRAKIHVLTQNATEQKLTDPAIATAVRNLQRSNALPDIPALHPDNLPHLLSFNWCFDPVYSGPSRKADAIHIAMFLKSSTGAIKTVRNIDDLRAIGETMKLTYKTIAMENEDTDFQFYDRLLTRTNDKILSGTEGRSVRHLHIDFLTRQINKLYTEWAKLFKSEKYLNTPIDHFYRVNEATLNFNPTEWLDLYNHSDPKTIPAQKGTERPDRHAARDDDRAPRNGKRDYPDRDARNRHDADKNKKPRRDASPPKQQKPDGRQPRRALPPPRQAPAPAPAASADICIRNLFHHADPVAFKLPCTRKPCPRDHNPPLRNGKLEEADKKAVRANLQLMEGKFAALALQQLDVLF